MKPRLAAVDRQPDAPAPGNRPHYLNRQWQYHPSSTHIDSQAFRERMAARLAAAQPTRSKR